MSKPEVTTFIYHRVKQKDMDKYRQWQPRISAACKEFEGFEDIQVFEPGVVTQNDNEFVQVIRFESDDLLKKWIDSEQRKNLLKETESFTIGQPKLTVFTGLEHWFGECDGPPRYKMTIVTFLALWPLVHFLPPALNRFVNIGQVGNEFLALVLIVLTMSYVALPLMCRVFRFWLKS